jgi:6-phosphogluconate dehydrogenase (decarboxylating)
MQQPGMIGLGRMGANIVRRLAMVKALETGNPNNDDPHPHA